MRSILMFSLLVPLPAVADAPQVVTDIPPIHSMVAQVMGDVGTPELLLDGQTSPHDASLRPSDARKLQDADLVIMVGDGLTPWLSDAVSNIAGNAETLELLEHLTVSREIEGHDHGTHGHDDHDDHGHEEEHADHDDHGHDEHKHEEHADHDDHGHDEHKHEEHADHDDHAHDEHKHEEHADHDDHGHEEEHAGHDDHGDLVTDPHAWLDFDNAAGWLTEIAEHLSEIDPDNAATYEANAAVAAEAYLAQKEALAAKLAGVKGQSFVPYHDAYGYFSDAFGLVSGGSLASNEAAPPSAADLRRVEDLLESGTSCVMTEVQYGTQHFDQLKEHASFTTTMIDPLGSRLEPGPALFGELMDELATAFQSCLSTS